MGDLSVPTDEFNETLYKAVKTPKSITLTEIMEQIQDGLIMEFGVASGESLRYIADHTLRHVYGFDSFDGLPEAWNALPAGAFKCKVPENLPGNVTLVQGLFQESIPLFLRGQLREKVALMHIDCDLYSSTKCILDHFKYFFQNGSIIIFDELVDYNGNDWKNHEFKAFAEFLVQTEYEWEYIGRWQNPHQAIFKLKM